MTAAVERMQHAFEVGDIDAICRATTGDAHRQIGASAHGEAGIPCQAGMNRALVMIEESLVRSGPPDVEEVEVDGDEATVTLARSGRPPARVPLRRTGGRWKVDNFYGVEALPEAEALSPAVFTTGASVVEPPPGDDVSVSDSAGRACAPLAENGSSGCRLRLSGEHDLTVQTVLGSFPLGHCYLQGILHFGGDGRIALHDMALPGPAPCNDVIGCKNRAGNRLPWRGELVGTPDGYRARLDVCLDTCVGRFAGPIVLTVEPGGNGWRTRLAHAPIGSGSLRLDGEARLAGSQHLELGSGEAPEEE